MVVPGLPRLGEWRLSRIGVAAILHKLRGGTLLACHTTLLVFLLTSVIPAKFSKRATHLFRNAFQHQMLGRV